MIRKKLRNIINDISFDTKQTVLRKINESEYVSFDIFDTLIRRDVNDPETVFRIVEKKTGIFGFAEKRISAEIIARKKHGEVNLSDIYSEIKEVDDSEKLSLINMEIETEKRLSCANDRALSFYRYVIRHKPVVLISDMYLSVGVLKEILDHCGVFGYSELFVSNECGVSKADGKLFDYVSEKLGTKSILHIGNDFKNDYLKAKREGYQTAKIKTHGCSLRSIITQKANNELYAFATNHASRLDYDGQFGYSCLGPVLYGFSVWLHDNIRAQDIDIILFLSRDGYIIKKAYEELYPEDNERLFYFEASRRSLRVPQYRNQQSLEEIIKTSPLLPDTNLAQIMDCLGLETDNYRHLLEKYGFTEKTRFKKKELERNSNFRKFYCELQPFIISNAEVEYNHLVSYLRQFDLSGNCAVVDIGWGGSMQQCLCTFFNEIKMDINLFGFYLGLSEKSNLFLKKDELKAKGYLFDCYNNPSDRDLILSFRSLFEAMFLEHKGSVKRYIRTEKGIEIERYPYEFESKGGHSSESARSIKEIQKSALQFMKDFRESPLTEYLNNDPKEYLHCFYAKGTHPSKRDVEKLGDIMFNYSGKTNYLAKPGPLLACVVNPKRVLDDLKDSSWKIGFMKRLLRIHLPYKKIYDYFYKNV